MITYKISSHAKTRYAERIVGKETTYDINKFVLEHENKIQTDICKMIEYGELLYTGKQSQSGKGSVIDVYIKDSWIILLDAKATTVVTLYKIDLGLDDDFNQEYISRMLDKLNQYKQERETVKQQVQEESAMYRGFIGEAEAQIKEYRAMIKNLEELCGGYKTIIDNNCVRVTKAEKNVTETVNALIGKKEF